MVEEVNIGEVGLDSIRVAGVKIGNLPIREAHLAKDQMRLAEDGHRKDQIKAVMKKFPVYQTPALEAGIKQAEDNIHRFDAAVQKERDTIKEFSEALALCRQRDKELRDLGVEIK